MEANEVRSFQDSKTPRFVQTISLGPPRQRPLTLQKPGATLFGRIEQRRLRQCSSCCAVCKVCTLPTIMDSLDTSARLLAHGICSLQTAIVLSESLPLVTFILKRCHARRQQRISEPVSKEFDASIATPRLLNQCSARLLDNIPNISKYNSKCSQLKK